MTITSIKVSLTNQAKQLPMYSEVPQVFIGAHHHSIGPHTMVEYGGDLYPISNEQATFEEL